MAKGKGTMQTTRISSLSKSQPPTQRHENYKIDYDLDRRL